MLQTRQETIAGVVLAGDPSRLTGCSNAMAEIAEFAGRHTVLRDRGAI